MTSSSLFLHPTKKAGPPGTQYMYDMNVPSGTGSISSIVVEEEEES